MRHYHYHIIILLNMLIFSGSWPLSVEAQESQQQVSLSLQEAIQLALKNNFEIRIERYNPEIAQENIREAEAAFAPEVSAGTSYTFNESLSEDTPKDTIIFEAGVAQQLKIGGNYRIDVQNDISDYEGMNATTNNSNGIALTMNYPLLKGRGTEVNTENLVIAEKNHEISVSQLRDTVTEILSDIQNTYWDLALARGVLEADRYSLQLANDLVKNNEAQVKVGALAPIEVLQAKATVASREVQIISDEQEVRNLEDELKRLLNISEHDPLWQAAIIPTTSLKEEQQTAMLDENIRLALEHREELQQLRTSLEIQEISLKTTQNQLLPELNIQGTFGFTGTDDTWGGAWSDLSEFGTYTMGIGLNFEYPLGNNAAKSEYTKAKLEHDQIRLSFQNLEQQITTQVKQAIRAVETASKQIEATKIAEQLAEEQLEAEQKKFDEGLSTNFQVLEYQEQLATARSNSTNAVVSYHKALVALDQATGMTLQRHDIVINE